MATSETITVNQPYADVFRTLVGVLPQHKMQVVSADEANGMIHVKTGIGMRTWGENISIHLGSRDGGATTEMVIDSNLKFGLTAWGKHKANFTTITQALDTAPASPPPTAQPGRPPPAEPGPPPTYPPPQV